MTNVEVDRSHDRAMAGCGLVPGNHLAAHDGFGGERGEDPVAAIGQSADMLNRRTRVTKVRRDVHKAGLLDRAGCRPVQLAASVTGIHRVEWRLRIEGGQRVPAAARDH